MDIQRLATQILIQRHPLLEISIQQPRALVLLAIPRTVIARERNGPSQATLDSGIDAKPDEMVQRAVAHGTDDVRRTDDVPGDVDGLAVGCEGVFLLVVEVAVDVHARVRLEGRDGRGAEVECVVFGARLEEEALGIQAGGLEGCDEVGEEGDCTVSAAAKCAILSYE